MRRVQSLECSLQLDATTGQIAKTGEGNYFKNCNQNLYHAIDSLKENVDRLQGIIQSQENLAVNGDRSKG